MGRRLRIMSGPGKSERQWPIGPTRIARLWNPPPPTSRLSTEVDGDPGPIRTGDLPLRRGTLYPAELRGHGGRKGYRQTMGLIHARPFAHHSSPEMPTALCSSVPCDE